MSLLKTIWGIFFRLFPTPAPVGLRRVGRPDRNSPVLLTCNFDLTVKRLKKILKRADVNAWLVVADSKGVNVWCAAGGDEFNTRTVVSAVKTCGVADEVDHRKLILPPLGGPEVNAADVREQTGWSTRWGPVSATDIPRYLDIGKRDEKMKRVDYRWRERLDTAFSSLFPIYAVAALAVLLFSRGFILEFIAVGSIAFLFFFLFCPWLPGKTGLKKALIVDAVIAVVIVAGELLWTGGGFPLRSELILSMVLLVFYGAELGGLASTMSSDLDPFLARLGIGAVGNTSMAGTVRTELLNGYRELTYQDEYCNGCRRCEEICPQGVWEMNEKKRAVLAHDDDCTACRACLTQCPTDAIVAPYVGKHAVLAETATG